MATKIIDRADNRPRLHLWPDHSGCWSVSFGPVGARSNATFPTPGGALDMLFDHEGGFDDGAVVIIEPAQARTFAGAEAR